MSFPVCTEIVYRATVAFSPQVGYFSGIGRVKKSQGTENQTESWDTRQSRRWSNPFYLIIALLLLEGCGGGSGNGGTDPAAKKNWGSADLIGDCANSEWYPQIVTEASGDALAMCLQSDGTVSLYRYTASSGWDDGELVATNNMAAVDPQIAIDANGNVLIVWLQSDGTYNSLWSKRYTVENGWGEPEKVEDNHGNSSTPQIEIDENGNALVVWLLYNGTDYSIRSNHYTVGSSSWGEPATVGPNGKSSSPSLQVAIDSAGNALAVWKKSDGEHFNIWWNRYTVDSSGWGTPALLEDNDSGNTSSPQVAINSAGNALAVWQQSDGTRTSIWSNRYTVGSNWGEPMLVEDNDSGNASSPRVTIDVNGNALVVWRQFEGTSSNFSIWSNRYTVGSDWGKAAALEFNENSSASNPRIAFDSIGNALAVWQERNGTPSNDSIWSNRYTTSSGWGEAELLESNDDGNAYNPQVAIDTSGNAVAIWLQDNDTHYNLWFNRFE